MIRGDGARILDCLGADRDITLECEDLLGRILYEEGDGEGAEKIHRDVLARRLNSQGAPNPQTSDTLLGLAKSLHLQGKSTESCQYAEQALRARDQLREGELHPLRGRSIENPGRGTKHIRERPTGDHAIIRQDKEPADHPTPAQIPPEATPPFLFRQSAHRIDRALPGHR